MKPILYTAIVPVRFSDLDPYGHVNSTHYLDYIISARWDYARAKLGITDQTMIEKKIGFYLGKAEMTFKRPIRGGGSVLAQSHVQEVIDSKLIVPFELRSADATVLHCLGTLEFAVIDLSTNRPVTCPDWVRDIFFEKI